MQLKPISYYARELKAELPPHVFGPVPRRAWWVLVHWSVILGMGAWVALARPHWALALLAALVMGHSVGCLGFVGHEILHGSVVRSRLWQRVLGQLCFAPYLLVVEFWHAWHNRTHHTHTQHPTEDPDLMPSVQDYLKYPGLRFTSRFMVGWRNPLTFLILSFGFISHQSVVLFTKSVPCNMLTPRARRRCLVKYFALLAAVLAWLPVLGPGLFALLVLLPIGLGNMLVMCYIMTNHNLNPRTSVNDPLVNSLTVHTPRWLGVLHMDFGYHVEHHIFPALSPAHARTLYAHAKRRWPELYQELPFYKALWLLMLTPRFYEDDCVLVDPKTGRRWVTLGAQNLGAAAAYLHHLPQARQMAQEALEMQPWTVATAREAGRRLLDQQGEKLGLAREQAIRAAREKWEMQSMKLSLTRETARTMIRLQQEKVRAQKEKFLATRAALNAQWREAQGLARQNASIALGEKRRQYHEALATAQDHWLYQKETLAHVRATAKSMVRQQKAAFLAARRLALAGG